jgi:hypothetical protein
MGKGWLLPIMSKKGFILLNVIKCGMGQMENDPKINKL